MNLSVFQSLSRTQLGIAVHGIGLAGVITIPALCYTFFLAENAQQVAACSSTIAADSAIILNRAELTEQRENTECELYALKQRLEELKAQIPNAPEESRFLAQLSKLAEESQLGIRHFRPGPPEDSNDVRRIRVQLSGVGSYECLCRFLNGLNSLPRLTKVSMLKVEPPNSERQYPVNLELSIFFAGKRGKSLKVASHG